MRKSEYQMQVQADNEVNYLAYYYYYYYYSLNVQIGLVYAKKKSNEKNSGSWV
jgi:hypothetical protein